MGNGETGRDLLGDESWPEQLEAKAVTPGEPRIWGFDVEDDLSRHYSFGEVVLLALTGEAPERARGRAFELALCCLLPTGVDEVPAHAAMLARMCSREESAILGTGAVALAEQSAALVREHVELLAWLDGGEGEVPVRFRAAGEAAAASRELSARLAALGFEVAALATPLCRTAALLAVLHAVGLRRPEQLQSALLVARLPAVAAEAFAHRVGIRDYAINLPRFHYLGGDDGQG